MTRMPMVRDMISELSPVPLAEDVNPDEAVAIGAAIQAMLSLLHEEEETGEKTLPAETRQQFSSRDGGLIQVTNITSHTLGVVLWDEAQLEEYVFPMIKKMTRDAGEAKNSFGTATANMQRAIVRDRRRRKHAAWRNARRWASATSSCRPSCPRVRRWS